MFCEKKGRINICLIKEEKKTNLLSGDFDWVVWEGIADLLERPCVFLWCWIRHCRLRCWSICLPLLLSSLLRVLS